MLRPLFILVPLAILTIIVLLFSTILGIPLFLVFLAINLAFIMMRRKLSRKIKTQPLPGSVPPSSKSQSATSQAQRPSSPSYQTQSSHSTPNQPPPAQTSLYPTIPNYTILEKLGEGGFATVYRALDNKGQEVAIKIYKSIGKDFVKEVAVWLNLNHPNIVRLLDYNIAPYPFVVMELMKGTLEGKRFDKTVATRIILDVLEGLRYAHLKGIVHRDIKPSNILLDQNGRAKVSDWGIARFGERTTSADVSMTLRYASPEQLRAVPADEKSDVYQVCEVFYEILTGKPAFPGDIVVVTTRKLAGEFNPPSALDPSLKEFDPVLRKCLSPRKEERYTDEELIKVLSKNVIENLTTTAKRTGSPYPLVELVYALVRQEEYERALFWLKELNNKVNCEEEIKMVEEKITKNYYTKEDIMKRIELLRDKVGSRMV